MVQGKVLKNGFLVDVRDVRFVVRIPNEYSSGRGHHNPMYAMHNQKPISDTQMLI